MFSLSLPFFHLKAPEHTHIRELAAKVGHRWLTYPQNSGRDKVLDVGSRVVTFKRGLPSGLGFSTFVDSLLSFLEIQEDSKQIPSIVVRESDERAKQLDSLMCSFDLFMPLYFHVFLFEQTNSAERRT